MCKQRAKWMVLTIWGERDMPAQALETILHKMTSEPVSADRTAQERATTASIAGAPPGRSPTRPNFADRDETVIQLVRWWRHQTVHSAQVAAPAKPLWVHEILQER